MNIFEDPNTFAILSEKDSPEDFLKVEVAGKTNPLKLWWQKSVVRRSMLSIEPDFEHIALKSPFLLRHAMEEKCQKGIGLFQRREILNGEQVGKGAFSQVFEVKAFQLDPSVSVKCTPEQQDLREQYVKTVFENGSYSYCIKQLQNRLIQSPKVFQCAASDLAVEAAFMSAFEHENILPVRGLPIDGLEAWRDGQHDGFFIISDRLVCSLDKRIQEWVQNQSPSIEEKMKYAMQLASALHYLHSNRIVFRDLKPHNIGFTADNKVKLFDFGLCRELPPDETCQGVYEMSAVGTRRYMAPEIINKGCYNLKVDVYGWSVVFWEILTLCVPYATYSTDEHRREVCHGGERPAIHLQWPHSIQNILRLSWEENVNNRFTMQEVRDYLQAALTTEKDTMKNELNFTDHSNLISNNLDLPKSPAGIHDFPVVASVDTKSMDSRAGPVDHFPALYEISPPPAPMRLVAFLRLPDLVVQNMSLSLDDEVIGI